MNNINAAGAEAVQALRQNAQPAIQQASAGVEQQVSAPGSGAGQLFAAPGTPGGGPAPPPHWSDSVTNKMNAMMSPGNSYVPSQPEEQSIFSDAMALAQRDPMYIEGIQNIMAGKDTGASLAERIFSVDYASMARNQRLAIENNDPAEIDKIRSSGDPLLDVIINWEQTPGQVMLGDTI